MPNHFRDLFALVAFAAAPQPSSNRRSSSTLMLSCCHVQQLLCRQACCCRCGQLCWRLLRWRQPRHQQLQQELVWHDPLHLQHTACPSLQKPEQKSLPITGAVLVVKQHVVRQ